MKRRKERPKKRVRGERDRTGREDKHTHMLMLLLCGDRLLVLVLLGYLLLIPRLGGGFQSGLLLWLSPGSWRKLLLSHSMEPEGRGALQGIADMTGWQEMPLAPASRSSAMLNF